MTDVSEALEEKVEHFGAMVYKCSVGFATERNIEEARESLFSEIRDLHQRLEEVREERDEALEEEARAWRYWKLRSEKYTHLRRQRDELVEAVREVMGELGQEIGERDLPKAALDWLRRLRDRLSDDLDGSEGEEERPTWKEFRDYAPTPEAETTLTAGVERVDASDADADEGYSGDHKLRLEHHEGTPQVTVDSWQAHCSCGWSSGKSTDRQTVIRKHAEHSPDAPDQSPVDGSADDVRQASDEELVGALESLAINFCLEAGIGYAPVKLHALEILRRLDADADEVGEEPFGEDVPAGGAGPDEAPLTWLSAHAELEPDEHGRVTISRRGVWKAVRAVMRRLDHPTDPPDEETNAISNVDAAFKIVCTGCDTEFWEFDLWINHDCPADDQPGEDGVGEERSWSCPKCGNDDLHTRYCDGEYFGGYRKTGAINACDRPDHDEEGFHHTCRTCQWEWTTFDTVPDRPEDPDEELVYMDDEDCTCPEKVSEGTGPGKWKFTDPDCPVHGADADEGEDGRACPNCGSEMKALPSGWGYDFWRCPECGMKKNGPHETPPVHDANTPPDEGEQKRVHTMKRGGPGPIRGADDQPGEDGVGEVRKAVGRALRSATAMEHPEMEIADPRGYWISREAYLALDQLMRERLTDPTDPPDEGEGVRVGPQASDKCGVEGCGHARHVHGTKFQDDDEKTGGCLVEGCGCLAFRHADDQPGEDGVGERVEDAEVVDEAAGYLESFVRRQHGADHDDGVHPALEHKYERDMTLVHQLRDVADRLRTREEGEGDE